MGLFNLLVLIPGATLAAMLASAQRPAMWLAHKVLVAPLRVGSFRISLATVMMLFCMIFCTLSYSSLCRAEHRLANLDRATDALLKEQAEKSVHIVGQNVWRYAMGAVLWAVAWRLSGLYATSRLVSHAGSQQRKRAPITRALYLAIGIVCLLCADIPLCRLNYNFQLTTFVTPKKDRLMADIGPCESAMSGSTAGVCSEFCANVRQLAEDRLWTITWTRSWHTLGAAAARLFDDARGVEQGGDRIDELFKSKTCAQVLKSVDKSNSLVNIFCALMTAIALGGGLAGISNGLGHGAPSPPIGADNRPHGD